MTNPFKYSNIVTGYSFCNRAKEQAELLEFIKASQNVLLYSHRRTGKSSLLKQVLLNIKTQQDPGVGAIYVDLYGTTSEKEFITKIVEQLSALESSIEKLLKLAKGFSSFTVQVGSDPNTGAPTLTPSFQGVKENEILKNAMDLLEKFSRKQKLVIIFDEFQEIGNYTNSDSFERLLRGYIQNHSNICYIFSGSQQHLLTEMFSSKKRAFYRQAYSYPLKTIKTKHYIPWLENLFSNSGIAIEKTNLIKIVENMRNHPMYIQLFCFFLWQELKKSSWDNETIDKIENLMIDQKHLEYQTLWDNLSLNQKKTLKLVLLNDGKNLFAAESLSMVDIKTASTATRCLKNLLEREILVKNGKYIIEDLFLNKWLWLTLIKVKVTATFSISDAFQKGEK